MKPAPPVTRAFVTRRDGNGARRLPRRRVAQARRPAATRPRANHDSAANEAPATSPCPAQVPSRPGAEHADERPRRRLGGARSARHAEHEPGAERARKRPRPTTPARRAPGCTRCRRRTPRPSCGNASSGVGEAPARVGQERLVHLRARIAASRRRGSAGRARSRMPMYMSSALGEGLVAVRRLVRRERRCSATNCVRSPWRRPSTPRPQTTGARPNTWRGPVERRPAAA